MKLRSTFWVFLLLLLNFPAGIKAQTMRDLFMELPAYCTPGLNTMGRKTLLQDTEYTVPARKEEDEIDYSIDTVAHSYMAFEYSNSKGKGINENYEMKELNSTDRP
jgi:hypothetical protein